MSKNILLSVHQDLFFCIGVVVITNLPILGYFWFTILDCLYAGILGFGRSLLIFIIVCSELNKQIYFDGGRDPSSSSDECPSAVNLLFLHFCKCLFNLNTSALTSWPHPLSLHSDLKYFHLKSFQLLLHKGPRLDLYVFHHL